ncbi:MAG: ABC transporter permease [Rhodobacteraceae bacterium]|nr:ABC transporter permease [Alphaproteobacteria bacterium]MBT8476869.1 ABC transporter permease [Alphaproteobacteria bacterium]NNK66256.1 ABC transporter permease [Paracoccaceae bacterium]
MFERRETRGTVGSALSVLWLIYHNTVRSVRKTHGNAIAAVMINILQMALMVAIFYVMFSLFGLRKMAIRGDFLLYIMSGIFMFMAHIRAMSAVVGSEGPASPMMQHMPMSTAVSIASEALGALYIQILSMGVILGVYHVGWGPLEIYDPIGAMAMLLMSWFSGASIGMVFLALKPWAPDFVGLVTKIFMRANMFASGKMFLANTLPATMLPMFTWNPLFHTIDQARGFMFINYNPHFSSLTYPLYVSLACLLIGLMGEFYTRKHASLSWSARR